MANAIIGALAVVLDLDSASFERKFKKVQEDVKGVDLTSGMKAGLKQLEGLFDDIAGKAGGLGRSLAVAGVAGGVLALALGGTAEALEHTEKALDTAAGFAKLSKELGVSTDFIQKFNFAAHQNEIDIGAADQALKGLNTSLGLVQAGLARSQTTKAFAALGFTPEQLRQYHDVGEFFPVLAQRIAATGNEAERAAIAQRLKIPELLPMLQEGADGFGELAQKAADLGIVMDRDVVQRAEEAKKKLNELADVTKARADITFAEFADTILAVKDAFAQAEKAGLSFLASITNTKSAETRLREIADRQHEILTSSQFRRPDGTLNPVGAQQIRELAAEAKPLAAQVAAKPAEVVAPPKPVTALVPGAAGHSNILASDQAVAAAQKAELQARIALTSNIAELVTLRFQEVDQERDAANTKLQDQVNAKKITAAAAAIATAKNNEAADEKKLLLLRQANFDAQNHELANREAINGFAQQAAQAQGALARTAEARNAFETKALADQQSLDHDRLKTELDQQRVAGLIDQDEEDRQIAAQALAQGLQSQVLAQQHTEALQKEANDRAEAGLQLQIDLLQSQSDASQSQRQRDDIGAHILQLEQQLERQKLEEVVASGTASALEKEIAAARLAQLPQIQANQQIVQGQAAFASAMDDATSLTADFASAVKDNDLPGAVAAFAKALQSFGGSNGTLAAVSTELAAAVAVFKAGSQLGASLAKAIGGDQKVGSNVGGFLGGIPGAIASLFGSNTAKKQKEQEAQAKAAEDAAAAQAKALSVANERRGIEIELLKAQGDAEGALNLQRQAELETLDAANQDIEKQLYALQDAADAAAQAAAVAAQGHDLQIQLLELTGDATGALAAKRADELAALDASNRGLQNEIYNLTDLATARDEAAAAEKAAAQVTSDAQTKLSAARDAEAQALNTTIQKFQAVADGLKAYRASLDAEDPAVGQNLAGIASLFNSTASAARLGDAAAGGALQTVSEQYRSAALAQATTAKEAAVVEAKIKSAVSGAADTALRQVSIAQQQLDALTSEVDALLQVNDSVLSVADAIKALQAAEAAQASASADALAAALDRLGPAEGPNIQPLPTLPVFDPGATVAPAIAQTSAVSPSGIDVSGGLGGGALSDLVMLTQESVVSNAETARILKTWDWNGQPDVRVA